MPPVVAAASDLLTVLPEIAEDFSQETGFTVKPVFGSSGNLAQQVLNGATFQIFMSADESYVKRLRDGGKADDDGYLYAIGRLVVFVPKGSRIRADSTLTDLGAALRDGRLRKLSIANPDHAPYGRAAKEALQHAGIWDGVVGALVLGQNAAQATQFAISGAADAAIIPYALALANGVKDSGSFAMIPESWHAPLRQRAVIISGADSVARMFFEHLKTPAARAMFERRGFTLPK